MSTAETLTRAPDAGPRVVLRRRSRPGGRAIVGAMLVTLAAAGTFGAYAGADGGPSGDVLVLRRAVLAGERISADDVRVERADLPDDVYAHTLHTGAEADGSVALASMNAGEMLQRSAVLPPDEVATTGSPVLEFALPVEAARALNGELVRGEFVDVLATYGTTESSYTEVVARRARVVDVSESGGSVGADVAVVLHLALTSADQVMATAHASTVASVTVVRSSRGAEMPLPDRYPRTSTENDGR